MFLVNSRQGYFCCSPAHATANPQLVISNLKLEVRNSKLRKQGRPYRELTAAFLPSSLTRNHSFALVFSTYPPVSVSGTVAIAIILDGFLGSVLYRISQTLLKGIFAAFGIGHDPHRRIFLPTFLTPRTSNPIMRSIYYAPSRHRSLWQCRNINLLSIACGIRHRLRPD